MQYTTIMKIYYIKRKCFQFNKEKKKISKIKIMQIYAIKDCTQSGFYFNLCV